MNTLQIQRALERDTFTKKIFGGVFAADELPKVITSPCGFVANTDPSTEPGTHWVLQSSWSNVCGQYCIFYLYHKSRGYSMSKIVNLFTDDTSINDRNVACYVKKHFNVVVENQPVCGLNQCCKPLFK